MTAAALRGRRRVFLVLGFCLVSLSISDSTANAAVPDPTAPGPSQVRQFDYRAGQLALTLPQARKLVSFNQPLRGSVTYPDSPGPWPVALMLHGRHETCIDREGEGFVPEPGYDNPNCPDVIRPDGTVIQRWVRSYQGYGYLARRLASQGYLVVSPDANLLVSYEFYSQRAGIKAREQVIGATLDLLNRWNAGTELPVRDVPGGPVVGEFSGNIDLERLAIMGHSRGGDAATQFIAFNHKRSTVYPLGGVVAIGPTDIPGTDPFRFGATNLAELLPGCDGDVTSLEGGHVFERIKGSHRKDGAELFQWLVQGANHNFFNTIWTDDDAQFTPATDLDSACALTGEDSLRASRPGQREIGVNLVNGFIRGFGGREAVFLPGLRSGSLAESTCLETAPMPCGQRVRPSWIAPAGQRRVVLAPAGRVSLKRNALGGRVTRRGLKLNLCNALEVRWQKQRRRCPGPRGGQESTVNRSWTSQLVVTWKKRSAVTAAVPATKRDVSRFADLVVRAATTLSPLNPVPRSNLEVGGSTQRMDIVLTDRAGHRARIAAENFSNALDPPVGDRTRQLLLGDVTIPLTAFVGVDLERIRTVGLEFGVRGRRHGQVQLAGLAFQGSAGTVTNRRPGTAVTPGPVPGPDTALDAVRLPLGATGNACAAGHLTVESGPGLSDGTLGVTGKLVPGSCESRIQVALFVRRSGLCRFVSADGGLGPAQDCDRPVSLIATLGEGGSWSLFVPWNQEAGLPEVSAVAVAETFPTG